MAYVVYILEYNTVSLVVYMYTLHGNCYNLNAVNSSLVICDFFVSNRPTANELYGNGHEKTLGLPYLLQSI